MQCEATALRNKMTSKVVVDGIDETARIPVTVNDAKVNCV